MQQIERYGVIALLFLLVTIVVVALWDGGDPTEASEGDAQAQVEAARQEAPARNTIQRRATPARGTRTQAQNQAQAQADRRASLSRGQANRDTLNQRSRLLNPGGVPANANATARSKRLSSNQKARQQAQQQVPAAFKAEPRRARDTGQWGRGSGPSANTTRIAQDPIPAVRSLRSQTKAQPKTQPKQQSRRQAQAQRGPTYVVKPGDTLERIARHTLSAAHRWPEIQRLNGLKTPTLQIGMKLELPTGADASRGSLASAKKKARGISEAASSNARSTVSAGTGIYVVKSGDVLGRIAQRELGSAKRWTEIVKLNPGLKPQTLRVGAKLKMPVGRKGAVKSSAVKPSGKRAKAKSDKRYTVQ